MRCAYLLKACCRRPSGLHSREVSSKGDVEEGSGFADVLGEKTRERVMYLFDSALCFHYVFSNRWSHHHLVQNISPYLTFVEVSVVCSCSAGQVHPFKTQSKLSLYGDDPSRLPNNPIPSIFSRIVASEVTCNPKDYVSLGSNLELLSTTMYIYIYVYTCLLATFEHLTVTIAPEL